MYFKFSVFVLIIFVSKSVRIKKIKKKNKKNNIKKEIKQVTDTNNVLINDVAKLVVPDKKVAEFLNVSLKISHAKNNDEKADGVVCVYFKFSNSIYFFLFSLKIII